MIGAVACYRFAAGERSALDEDIFVTGAWAR
jgi:hypothetical protein